MGRHLRLATDYLSAHIATLHDVASDQKSTDLSDALDALLAVWRARWEIYALPGTDDDESELAEEDTEPAEEDTDEEPRPKLLTPEEDAARLAYGALARGESAQLRAMIASMQSVLDGASPKASSDESEVTP